MMVSENFGAADDRNGESEEGAGEGCTLTGRMNVGGGVGERGSVAGVAGVVGVTTLLGENERGGVHGVSGVAGRASSSLCFAFFSLVRLRRSLDRFVGEENSISLSTSALERRFGVRDCLSLSCGIYDVSIQLQTQGGERGGGEVSQELRPIA